MHAAAGVRDRRLHRSEGLAHGFGSLLLGIHDETGKLRYAGSVGTGFDQTRSRRCARRSTALASETTPFFEKPRDVKGHWVRPELVAEVSFAEWTPDGRIRHSVFHGLRDDKARRAASPASSRSSAVGRR